MTTHCVCRAQQAVPGQSGERSHTQSCLAEIRSAGTNGERMNGTWWTSRHRERFAAGPYETRYKAVVKAVGRHDLQAGDHFFVGRREEAEVCFPGGDDIVEHMALQMHGQVGEVSDDWPDVGESEVNDLTRVIAEACAGWVARHKLTPAFFAVVDVEELRVCLGEPPIEVRCHHPVGFESKEAVA